MSGNLDLDVRTTQPIPPATVPIADPKTGLINPSWARMMRLFWQATGMQGGTFRGMPKIGSVNIAPLAPGANGAQLVVYDTPWPNFAEVVVVSSSDPSILVAAHSFTLTAFTLAYINRDPTLTLGAIASLISYGG